MILPLFATIRIHLEMHNINWSNMTPLTHKHLHFKEGANYHESEREGTND